MMEGECFELDLEIFAQLSGQDFTSATTARQVQLSRELKELEEDEEKLKNEIIYINSAIITQVLHKPDSEQFIKSMYRSRLDEIQKELHEKVFVNILVKFFVSEETNRTVTGSKPKLYIAPYMIYFLLIIIITIIFIYIYIQIF